MEEKRQYIDNQEQKNLYIYKSGEISTVSCAFVVSPPKVGKEIYQIHPDYTQRWATMTRRRKENNRLYNEPQQAIIRISGRSRFPNKTENSLRRSFEYS